MTRISAFPEPVYPVIADADTSRGESIISRERLIGAGVIVAPLEHQVSVGIQDFASPLCISAQRGGFPRCIADHDLLTVLPEQLPSNRQFPTVREAEHCSEGQFVITLDDVSDPAFLPHNGPRWANPLKLNGARKFAEAQSSFHYFLPVLASRSSAI